MNIWNGIECYPHDAGHVVATIGNYDGVHLGHRAILDRVVQTARARGLRSLLVSFSPHPLAVIAPERRPRLLQTRGQKLESLQQLGLSDLLILEFTPELAALTAQEFFDRILDVAFTAVVVGDNFRFGHRRHGDLELLRRIGHARGFEVHGVPPLRADGAVISSSAIREALDAGDVERAARWLGRPYAVAGEVVHGDGRGRELGCPTANLELENEVVPARGVYVTETLALAGRFPSVTNVGVRPTFGGEALTVETHLLGFDDDLYHERVGLRFLARLRDERRFPGSAALADQIARDRAAAEAYFQNRPFGER
jgi:riboflavin kinase/FMN adenylyltransferase